VHGAGVVQARLRAGLVLLMLPGGLSSPGPTLSGAEKRAAEKVPPLLPVLSSPYRDRLLSPHPRYPNDERRWRDELYARMGEQTKTSGLNALLQNLGGIPKAKFKMCFQTSHLNVVYEKKK